MPAIEIALPKAIEERWAKYAKELLRCRRKLTEAAVHDLRIACRRMIALIDVLLMIIPQRTLKRLGRDLKRQLSTLSPLRDTQMEILEVRRLVERHPQLKPFLTVLLVREQRLLKSARNRIGEIQGEDHRAEIQAVMASLHEALAEPEVKAAAIAVMTGAMASGFSRSATGLRKIDPTDTKTIHRLRLEVKRFRYSIEILGPILGAARKEQLTALRVYQTTMGAIQDNEVLIADLNAFIRKRHRTRRGALLHVLKELNRVKADLIEQFLLSRNKLLECWTL